MSFKKAGKIRAFLFLAFSKAKYADLAAEHVMWLNLQKDDLRIAFEAGTFTKKNWKEEQREKEVDQLVLLRMAFFKSLIITGIVSLLVISIGFGIGTVSPKLSINIPKILSFIGGFMAAWGAVFQLTDSVKETWGKETLSEVMHRSIFFILFVLGVFISLLSLVV